MTKAERQAFEILIKMQIPVYVEKIIYPYICDFVGMDRNFILEIDGNSHDNKDDYDDRRSKYLHSLGFEIFRLDNKDICWESIYAIMYKLPTIGIGIMDRLITNANHKYYYQFSY